MKELEIQHDDSTRDEIDVDEIVDEASNPDRVSVGLDAEQNTAMLAQAKLAALSRCELLRVSIIERDWTGHPASEIWTLIIQIEHAIRAAREDGDVPPF